MTESQFTSKLLRALRAAMPEATIWKHSDRFTGGIPDFSVTRWHPNTGMIRTNQTSWCEVKLLRNGKHANNHHKAKLFVPLQQETLKRIGGWMLIWSEPQRKGYLFRPDELGDTPWYEVEALGFAELVERIRRTF
jgi:hypothetical protein